MKATDQSPEQEIQEVVKSTKIVVIPESLITIETLRSKFTHLKKNLDTYKKYAINIKIENDDQLAIADNNLKQINENINSAEEIRKTLGDPHRITTKEVNDFCKGKITEPLGKAKIDITKEVTNYKTVQAALAAKVAEEKEEEIKKTAKKQLEETDKISRIQLQLIARIYGGSWINAKEENNSSEGSLTVEDCNALLNIIDTKIPKADSFTYLKETYINVIKDVKAKLAKHIIDITESNSSDSMKSGLAYERIAANSLVVKTFINDTKDKITKTISKEVSKEIKSSAKLVKNESKGIRNNVKVKIANIKDVPEEWLILNEALAKSYAITNKEEVFKRIKEGDNIINGIEYTIEQTYVSR